MRSPPIKAVAVGGYADGQVLEFHGGVNAWGWEKLPMPSAAEVAAGFDRAPMEETFTVHRTLYTLEEMRNADGGAVHMAVAEGWSVMQALERLLFEHRLVG